MPATLYKYKQNRVGVNSFSFFQSIPTAEKTAIGCLIFSMAAGFLTGSTNLFTGMTLLMLAKYCVDKYGQDMAVARYYEEIKGINDAKRTNAIYATSENVKAMGGADAIENACAIRIFRS